jgi:hypothetical protein
VTYDPAFVVKSVNFPWHSFFFGAVKCFRDHFAYSGFIEGRYPHLGSFVLSLSLDVVAYSLLDVSYLFVNALFFFFSTSSFSCLF